MNKPIAAELGLGPFFQHLWRQARWAAVLVLASIIFGTLGFHTLVPEPWVDALLNTCMLLGGMGPVGDLGATSGKLFASAFALYAGLVFLIVAGLLVTPVFHRVLHKFHVEGRQTVK
jgi:hypothetical protein